MPFVFIILLDLFVQLLYPKFMLDSLITSKTRIRLIVKFFLNPGVSAYLRELASEFGESTNSLKQELDKLSKSGILSKDAEGRVIKYSANRAHPLFPELTSIVRKYSGIDKIVENVLSQLGKVEKAYIVGDYAKGIDSGIIDLVIVGDVDLSYLYKLITKVEQLIKRKIRVLVIKAEELEEYGNKLKVDDGILLVGAT